ncbi:glycosyltransferase [Paenibacillus sp. GCM10023248]|uniref:glycosyltransferase n=1 Tax=unclassified Paenibacillus TaxID=185978 RepID=UPI002378C35D|nr:glycosyltransferase [Paenibacillus sp. MAHUQ-63]MDD9266624.1 glycosyltransferase [Paenibacillus sp. MAHUQ-63]
MVTVSIIVRTLNRNLLLKRTIQSIRSQTYRDWEIIVVNNGGDKDELEETLQDDVVLMRDKLKIIHMNKSEYMEVATNVGIKNSIGEYITLLDDDDTWDPSFLEKCVAKLEMPNIYGVATRTSLIYEVVQDRDVRFISLEKFNGNLKNVSLYKLARRNLFTTNSFMYKRSLLNEIGYYREDLPVLGDWEFNLRFRLNYPIYVIPEYLANYHKRLPQDKIGSLNNTQIKLHLQYDKKLRYNYLSKGFRGEIPFCFGLLIFFYMYLNFSFRGLKKMIGRG